MIEHLLLSTSLLGLALLLGATAYESIVIAPNYEREIPASIDLARRFLQRRTPAHYFRLVSPLTQILLLVSAATCWRTPSARWLVLIAFAIVLLVDVITYAFQHPRLSIMFKSPMPKGPRGTEGLRRAAREWAIGNWVRGALLLVAFLLVLQGLVARQAPAPPRLDAPPEANIPLTQPDGYFAAAPGDQGRPVLVLHAWWGLNNNMKTFCARLARAGFTVFAPDLYHGQTAHTVPAAEALSNALDARQAKADVAVAARFLEQRAGRRDIAVIGFSLGAYFALDLSTTDPERIGSVVVFYGTGPTDFSRSQAKYLGHFAEVDEFEPDSQVGRLEGALRSAGRPVTIHRYPGTGHWFFESDRPQFDAAAADVAWERTLAFLKEPSP